MKHRTLPLALALILAWLPVTAHAQSAAATAADELAGLLDPAVVEQANEATERYRATREAMDAAMKSGSQEQQRTATRDMEQAREQYRETSQKLDAERVRAIADQSGRSPADIQSMRNSGMGWGAIAKETGVHASVNAKGKGKNSPADDAIPTDDDTGSGKSKSKSKGKGKK
jgi:hypothetical protein